MMHRPCAAVAALACVVSVWVPGAPAAEPDTSALASDPAIQWEACNGDAECAVLQVPLDYDVAGGRTIGIALVRYRALDPQRRIGSLLMNPGGPGASGVEYVLAAAGGLPARLQDRFDIIGFDPRGVGASEGVDCLDDLGPYFDAEWAPDDEAERRDLEEEAQALAAACEQSDGDILPFLRTELAARDMDRIREALGDEQLTYVGYSYGTYLGAWYADQFPERVRALVLDAPIDPSLDAITMQVQQAVGFEQVLDDFLQFCAQQRSCPFHRGGRSASAYDRLRAEVGATPLLVKVGGEPRDLNGSRFDLAVTQVLYEGTRGWGQLAGALDAADRGDGSDLLFYADYYTGRIDDGEYEDGQESFLAIGCVDGPSVGGVDGMREIERSAEAAAPRLGRSIVNGSLVCAYWPIPPDPPRALTAEGAEPIIVLGARHDPATPFAWAKGLVAQLESGVLVSVRGAHHASFDSGNACVDRLVVRYLTRLESPQSGTRC